MDVDGSIGSPKHVYAKTDEDEGEERSDICQISERSDVGQHGHATDRDAGPDSCDVRRAKAGVNSREYCEAIRREPWP